MKFNGWQKVSVVLDDGSKEPGIAPIIISASRSTDIPAFYAPWFIDRLNKGYLRWGNPFSNKLSVVSFSKLRLIVFWSKNPAPLLQYLHDIDKKNIGYFFHFTMNDYEKESLEPNVPSLSNRIATFKQLSQMLGKEKVLWRFDPLILTDTITVDTLLERIRRIGDQIAPYTSRLTVSFLSLYEKVKRNMARSGYKIKDVDNAAFTKIGMELKKMSEDWGIRVVTCAEKNDLHQFGIGKGACIDAYHIERISPCDHELKTFLNNGSVQTNLLQDCDESVHPLKDPGQRELCRCIASKDIGSYNTCPHLCVYCYANASTEIVVRNSSRISYAGDTLLYR